MKQKPKDELTREEEKHLIYQSGYLKGFEEGKRIGKGIGKADILEAVERHFKRTFGERHEEFNEEEHRESCINCEGWSVYDEIIEVVEKELKSEKEKESDGK